MLGGWAKKPFVKPLPAFYLKDSKGKYISTVDTELITLFLYKTFLTWKRIKTRLKVSE